MTASTSRRTTPDADYPRTITLKRRRTVDVRPMTVEDAEVLHQFFVRIPTEDLLFLRHDVADRVVIESW